MRNFNVTVDGKTYQVQVEETNSTAASAPVVSPVVAATPPAPAPVVAATAPAPAAKPTAFVPQGGIEMKAPMPGMINDLKVANGATVKEGDIVLILEAMKMENEIVAPAGGVITFVVQKGASVNSGDIIAVIK